MRNNHRNKYLAKNTATIAFGDFCYKAVHFLLVPLCTYTLTTEQYGTVELMITVLSIINAFTMCSIGDATRRYLLDKNFDENKIRGTQFFWNGFGVIFSFVLYFILKLIPSFSSYAFAMSLYTFTSCLLSVFLDYLLGKERVLQNVGVGLSVTLCSATLSFIFLVKLQMGVGGYFYAYIIPYFFGAIIAFFIGSQHKNLKSVRFDKSLFKEMTKFSLAVVPNSIMLWIISSSDKIMVSSMISASANGLYSVAYKLPSVMSMFSEIITKAWQFSAVKECESEDSAEYQNKMFRFYFSSIALISVVLLLILKPFMSIYVSENYYSAWKYCPFLIIGIAFQTLGDFIGTNYFVAKDMKGNLKSSTVGAVLNIILNFALIPIIGANGAAIATCLSYVAIFIYRLIDTRKYIRIEAPSLKMILMLLVTLASAGIVYLNGSLCYILISVGLIINLILSMDIFIPVLRKVFELVKGSRQ